MSQIQKIRVTFNETCDMLGLSRDGLRKLIKKDPTFPKPIKEGEYMQAPVWFDHQAVLGWWATKQQAAA